jgi:hypothetical protein
LANYVAVTGSYLAALNNGLLHIFSGPVPASADDAIDGTSVLLATITVGGDGSTPLTFEATATNGVLTKKASETWSGDIVATGTASFMRFAPSGDDCTGAANASTGYRLQDTVGVDATAGLILTSVDLVSGNTQTIDLFQVS